MDGEIATRHISVVLMCRDPSLGLFVSLPLAGTNILQKCYRRTRQHYLRRV